jgi:hypothetical protein
MNGTLGSRGIERTSLYRKEEDGKVRTEKKRRKWSALVKVGE